MQTITVPFHGNALYVVNCNDEPYTPMRPIIEGMGLAYQGQAGKLKSRFAKGVMEIMIPTQGGPQKMLCLALRKLNGWLQTKNR
ncbi:phage antirepressor N-terminal domain-containing protein [Symbiopectobacterium sp. RP]|uniref:phage antirepressor N-terminal domain-containing protein n=1 Tax=Symbiopectobacterium sp. RP TaxID=3248553 RepID=UPI003D27BAB2